MAVGIAGRAARKKILHNTVNKGDNYCEVLLFLEVN